MAEDNDLHTEILEMLLDKVRDDPFPSVTQMDLIEGILRDDDDLQAYTSVLLDKVRQDAFPSLDQLHRLIGFA